MKAKQRFLDTMVAVAKTYSLCGLLDEATALRKIAALSAIKAAITKFYTVDKRSTEEKRCAEADPGQRHRCRRCGRHFCACRIGQAEYRPAVRRLKFLEDVRQMDSRNWPSDCWKNCCAMKSRRGRAQQRGAGEEVRRPSAGNPTPSITTVPSRLHRSLRN